MVSSIGLAARDLEHTDLFLPSSLVQMPELDGRSATRIIREYEANLCTFQNSPSCRRRIPIIALTANAMKGDEEACLASGMDRFIAKPINARKLKETILEMAGNEEFRSYYKPHAHQE